MPITASSISQASQVDLPDLGSSAADPIRRRRRSREEVAERIRDAARQLFAERGYHGATTREIARVADVSETLLFRYYGSKATLFEDVVYNPFNTLMQDFFAARPTSAERTADEHYIFSAVYELFEKNRALFTALLSVKGMEPDEGGPLPFNGLLPFFKAATNEMLQKHEDAGQQAGFDLGLGLRLTFGMLAASVLLRDWLFPDGVPPREQIVATLEAVVGRSLYPDG